MRCRAGQRLPFLAFDLSVRKLRHAANSVESLNKAIRKRPETTGAFPTGEAAAKAVRLAVKEIPKGRSRRARGLLRRIRWL